MYIMLVCNAAPATATPGATSVRRAPAEWIPVLDPSPGLVLA